MGRHKDHDAVERARVALARGYTIKASAAYAGVTRKAVHDWLASEEYGDSLRNAQARGDALLERSVLRDAKKDGKLALDVLSRRSRAWQRKDAIRADVTVRAGLPKSPEEAADELRSLLAAYEGKS